MDFNGQRPSGRTSSSADSDRSARYGVLQNPLSERTVSSDPSRASSSDVVRNVVTDDGPGGAAGARGGRCRGGSGTPEGRGRGGDIRRKWTTPWWTTVSDAVMVTEIRWCVADRSAVYICHWLSPPSYHPIDEKNTSSFIAFPQNLSRHPIYSAKQGSKRRKIELLCPCAVMPANHTRQAPPKSDNSDLPSDLHPLV